jgi:hypothetical protein
MLMKVERPTLDVPPTFQSCICLWQHARRVLERLVGL